MYLLLLPELLRRSTLMAAWGKLVSELTDFFYSSVVVGVEWVWGFSLVLWWCFFAMILIVAHGVEWDDGRNCKAFSKYWLLKMIKVLTDDKYLDFLPNRHFLFYQRKLKVSKLKLSNWKWFSSENVETPLPKTPVLRGWLSANFRCVPSLRPLNVMATLSPHHAL